MRSEWLIIFLAAFSGSCQVPKTANSGLEETKKIAFAKLGDDCTISPSESGKYLLAVQNPSSNATVIRLQIIVIRVSDSSVVFQKTFIPGHVKWLSDASLELLDAPEMIPKGKTLKDYIKIIHLKNQTKDQ